MSLLMKALEKAAQDRNRAPEKAVAQTSALGVARDSSTPASAASRPAALSLEPIEPVVPRTEPAMPAANPKPDTSGNMGATARGTPRSPDQVRAAVVLSAQSAGSSAGAWISAHPVPFTAALAGIFAVGYGIYIYLQAAHPSLFIRIPPAAPLATAKPAPEAPTPSAVSGQSPATADTPLILAQSVFSSRPDTAQPAALPSSPLLPPPAADRAFAPAIGAAAAKPAPGLPAAAPIVGAAQSKIVISRGDNATPRVNAAVGEAYAALEAGRFDAAQRLYEQALRAETNNIDALLGLAAIAQHENRAEDASRHYLKILDIEPRHALAQTGLIALVGRADPLAAETRLKQLVAREPSPALFFTLGNLYADQGQWSQAQQAYFQAHHMDAGNPDYAYNLAVALEHLGQQKLALGFYRRALQLAAGRGRANFNSSQAQARITQLAARLD